ncbi:MAG: hypothetical protein E6Q97_17120 [Desulfurellales bacterium]|nr:MAG: hypothetical protein E6Q97_17120 [Desulfurellales bacterium]
MRTTIYIYLPPDEWTIVFSWGSSNTVSFRIRAESRDQVERVADQMRRRLEAAVDECAEMVKTVSEKKMVMFDD